MALSPDKIRVSVPLAAMPFAVSFARTPLATAEITTRLNNEPWDKVLAIGTVGQTTDLFLSPDAAAEVEASILMP